MEAAIFGTYLAFDSAQSVFSTSGVSIMKKQRKQKTEETIALRIWTLLGAMKIVPYLRSVVKSLRDAWLEMRQAQEQVRRVETRPGRPDRDSLILLEESRRDLRRAEAKLEEIIDEMLPLSVYSVDPGGGLAVLPFLSSGALAWFVFDLFDPQGLVGWRLHSDSLETRRPLADIEQPQPPAGIAGDPQGGEHVK